MKRKIIVLILILLLTTGCTANYSITIDENSITETTIFTGNYGENSKEYVYSLYEEEHPIYDDEEFLYYSPKEKIEGQTYYDKNIIETGDEYRATYKATYTFDRFQDSSMLHTAYSLVSVVYDDYTGTYNIAANNLKIFASNKYLTNIRVSIDIKDYEVVDSNEDQKNGNVYIWDFDRNSKGTLNFVYKKVSKDTPKPSPKPKNKLGNYTLYIFCGILLILVLIGYKIFNKIKNQNDVMND